MPAPALVTTSAQLREAIATLRERPILACDLETTGLDPHQDEVLMIQLGDDRYQMAVDTRTLRELEPLREVLERPGLTVFHNAQFDLKFLSTLGLRVSQPQDTMLCEALIAGGRRLGPRTLKACADRRAGISLDKTERATFQGHQGALTESQIAYAVDDVIATWHLFVEQIADLDRDELDRVARIEGAAVEAFADLELRGMHLEPAAWEGVLAEAEAARDAAKRGLEQALLPIVGGDLFGNVSVNYDSEPEMLGVFERLGFPGLSDLGKGTLQGLGHPVADELLRYRTHQHTLKQYGDDGFTAHLHPKTGRLHPRVRQIGAGTGRVSVDSPNLQNVRRGDMFRRAFQAPAGRKLITADYNAAELRIIAALSRDPAFIETFEAGGDLHSEVATRLFKTPVTKESRPELRERAKAINFGLAYGMGAAGLGKALGVTVEEADELLQGYFKTYPKIRQFLTGLSERGLARGFARSAAGRRLYFEPTDEPARRAQQERVARNMPIQGTGADILKLAMARVTRAYHREGLDAFLVNSVHDELIVEASEGDAPAAAAALEREMNAAAASFLKEVPSVVDVSIDDYWAK